MEHPKCGYCDLPATKLYFYSKTYSDTGKDTIESPIICCDECSFKARQDLSVNRGGIEGIFYKTFKSISKMSHKEIVKFFGRKGKEFNHLANRQWRSLMFRIHYLNLPPKNNNVSL